MASLPVDKLKNTIVDIQTRLKTMESRVELLTSILEEQKTLIKTLHDSREETANLKSSHKSFSQSFNENVKNIHETLDIVKIDTSTQIKSLNQKIDSLRNDIQAEYSLKHDQLTERVDNLTKMFDY